MSPTLNCSIGLAPSGVSSGVPAAKQALLRQTSASASPKPAAAKNADQPMRPKRAAVS